MDFAALRRVVPLQHAKKPCGMTAFQGFSAAFHPVRPGPAPTQPAMRGERSWAILSALVPPGYTPTNFPSGPIR